MRNRVKEFRVEYDQFVKDVEKIFKSTTSQKTTKLVMCGRCGDTVSVREDCSCGYIGAMVKRIMKKGDQKVG